MTAMLPYLGEYFGNRSSTHDYGERPRRALDEARAQVATMIGAQSEEIVFTGSGSEANLLALRGAVLASSRPRPHLITQATEHPAVLETSRALERLHGVRVTVLPVNRQGRVEPDTLAAALDPDTVLVSVMAANNETGTLQPIAELAALAHQHGALFHCDAAQATGKIPVDVGTWASTCSLWSDTRCTPQKGSPLSTYVTGYGSNRSSTAAAKNSAREPAPRTPHSPSPSGWPPTSPPKISPKVVPPGPRRCATASSRDFPTPSPGAYISTVTPRRGCPTLSTSVSTE
jgi:hypothetical protein